MAPTTLLSAEIGTSTSERRSVPESRGTAVFDRSPTTTGRWGVRGSGAPAALEASLVPTMLAGRPLTALTSYPSSRSRNIHRYAASPGRGAPGPGPAGAPASGSRRDAAGRAPRPSARGTQGGAGAVRDVPAAAR